MPHRKSLTFYCWLCALTALAMAAAMVGDSSTTFAAEPAAQLPELLKEDFENGADRWKPTDKEAWKLVKSDNSTVLSLFQQSKYKPKYRSPLNYTLLQDTPVGDFMLDVKARSTAREYGHRDVCLIFGHQNADQFYYVHLATKQDDHAHQIFIVNNAARTKISETSTKGVNWTEGWHQIRVMRTASDGKIAVYFDDLEKPVMTATNKTFGPGKLGLGSFDDTADFDDVVLSGVKVTTPAQ
jgi:hypothetical protein